jgi:UDP-N-acetylglucosamine enolpyruvyl transferase
MKLHEMIAVS